MLRVPEGYVQRQVEYSRTRLDTEVARFAASQARAEERLAVARDAAAERDEGLRLLSNELERDAIALAALAAERARIVDAAQLELEEERRAWVLERRRAAEEFEGSDQRVMENSARLSAATRQLEVDTAAVASAAPSVAVNELAAHAHQRDLVEAHRNAAEQEGVLNFLQAQLGVAQRRAVESQAAEATARQQEYGARAATASAALEAAEAAQARERARIARTAKADGQRGGRDGPRKAPVAQPNLRPARPPHSRLEEFFALRAAPDAPSTALPPPPHPPQRSAAVSAQRAPPQQSRLDELFRSAAAAAPRTPAPVAAGARQRPRPAPRRATPEIPVWLQAKRTPSAQAH